MAYRLLSLTAISGEFPTDQLNRLPGSPYYLESVITALKKDGLLRTYYRDKLRGYRLGPRAKATLLESRPDRFASYLTGNTDTNRLKCEIDRRLRLHRLAETYVTMDNAGVCVYRDEKPAIFAPEGYAGGRIVYPAFFSSREVKEMGIDTTKIRSSRSTGILLAPSGIFVTYNSSSALMKWRYKSEMRVKALIWSVICQQRLSSQFRHLELPGQQPCAYFLVTSDQDSTFDFLASLFLSFCFIKLVRYADHNCEGGKLPVPVHILGEELTACGTIPDLSRRLSVIRSRNISMSCVFQNLAGLQNRYPQNLWQEIIGNCDAQLFLGCTDQLTAEFISARTGLASVAVSSQSKQLGTWRISNYTPEFRETSGVGKRPVLTPDEVLRLPLDQALIIIRGKKVLQVDKMDYSKHPEAKYLRSCKASAHVPEWRRLEEEAAKTPQPTPKPAPAAKKPAKRKATKPASPTDKSPKEAPAPKSAGTPEGIITTDKDSILS